MKSLLAILLMTALVGSYWGEIAAGESQVRFEIVDVLIESSDHSLAAYQFTFKAEKGQMKIVGVEGGDHPAFSRPPYYDPKALKQGRIKIAAFSTDQNLPTGKTRVARLHLQVSGTDEPDYIVILDAAADSEGKKIPAMITVVKGKGDAK